jgi:hypothetical protein
VKKNDPIKNRFNGFHLRLPKPLKIKVASAFHSVILRAHFVGLTVRSFQQSKMENGLKFLRSIECGWLQ